MDEVDKEINDKCSKLKENPGDNKKCLLINNQET